MAATVAALPLLLLLPLPQPAVRLMLKKRVPLIQLRLRLPPLPLLLLLRLVVTVLVDGSSVVALASLVRPAALLALAPRPTIGTPSASEDFQTTTEW